ncbi:hypothetical protein [Psychromarinibacter sp. S121]
MFSHDLSRTSRDDLPGMLYHASDREHLVIEIRPVALHPQFPIFAHR